MSAKTNGLSKKEDRLGVIINIYGNFYLLGIPAMDNGCDISQFNEIKNLLEEYKIEMKIDFVTFDVCATNTGTLGGTIKLLSEWLNKPLLHHIKEILASDFYKNILAKKNISQI